MHIIYFSVLCTRSYTCGGLSLSFRIIIILLAYNAYTRRLVKWRENFFVKL